MLTDRQIQAAIKSVATEITLNDGAAGRGTGSLKLVIRRTSKGVFAGWFATWKTGGKRGKKSLGRYPDITLAMARQKFSSEISPLIQAGKNPKAAAARLDSPTVGALFAAYVAHLRQDGAKSAGDIERILLTGKHNAADGLGRDSMAGDIEPGDVANYLAKAYGRGKRRQADVQRTYMAAAFSWAIKATHDYRADQRADWGVKYNPAAMVPRDEGANRTRERNLSAKELRALWAVMESDRFSLEVSGAVRLIICCGQRVRETLRAKGSDFDLDNMLWTLPQITTKGGKPHQVPLPRQAAPVLRKLIEKHGKGPLFPASESCVAAAMKANRQAPEHIKDTSIQRAMRRWSNDEKLEPFQTRDLRRTWKSRTADAGIDRFTRDLIQQHAQGGTGTVSYDRADYMPQMRAAMKKWSTWLDRNVTGKAVTKLREAA